VSTVNLRMASAIFSVAIASSFISKRKLFSSKVTRSRSEAWAFSGVNLASIKSVLSVSCSSRSGLIVRRSQPASYRISPVLRKLAPIISVS
jgi:hypothetical protein